MSELSYEASDEASENELLDRSLSVWREWSSMFEETFNPIPLDIHTASSIGQYDCVRTLIARGEVEIDRKNIGGWTPLMYACYIGHDAIVNLLMDAGCNVNLKNPRGQTPLMLAASCGNESVGRFLLRNGAELEAADWNGWTALFHATYSGHQNFVSFLLDQRSNMDAVEPSTGLTPFMEAAIEGHEIIVQLFLQHGVNVNAKAYNGDTARTLALMNSYMKIVSLIDNYVMPHTSLRSEPGLGDYLSSSDELDNRQRPLHQRGSRAKSKGPSIRDGPEAIARMIDRTRTADAMRYPHLVVPRGYMSFPHGEGEQGDTQLSYRDVTSPINQEDYHLDSSGGKDSCDYNDDSNAFSKTGAITIKSSSSSSGGLIAALRLSRQNSADSDEFLLHDSGVHNSSQSEDNNDANADPDSSLDTGEGEGEQGERRAESEESAAEREEGMERNAQREEGTEKRTTEREEGKSDAASGGSVGVVGKESSGDVREQSRETRSSGGKSGHLSSDIPDKDDRHGHHGDSSLLRAEEEGTHESRAAAPEPDSPRQPATGLMRGAGVIPEQRAHNITSSSSSGGGGSGGDGGGGGGGGGSGGSQPFPHVQFGDLVFPNLLAPGGMIGEGDGSGDLPALNAGPAAQELFPDSGLMPDSRNALFDTTTTTAAAMTGSLESVGELPLTAGNMQVAGGCLPFAGSQIPGPQIPPSHPQRRSSCHSRLSRLAMADRDGGVGGVGVGGVGGGGGVGGSTTTATSHPSHKEMRHRRRSANSPPTFHREYGGVRGQDLGWGTGRVSCLSDIPTNPGPHAGYPLTSSTRPPHIPPPPQQPPPLSSSSSSAAAAASLSSHHPHHSHAISGDPTERFHVPVAAVAPTCLHHPHPPPPGYPPHHHHPHHHPPPPSSAFTPPNPAQQKRKNSAPEISTATCSDAAQSGRPQGTTCDPQGTACDPQHSRLSELVGDYPHGGEGCGHRDLAALLEQLGVGKYSALFAEQDVDLQVFLSLTDNDLKEIGIKLFGPRKKMTNAIARWHSQAPAARSSLEQAYADRLEGEMQEMAIQLNQAYDSVEKLKAQVLQERQLRSVTESCLMEERAGWQRVHHSLIDTHQRCRDFADAITKLSSLHSELRQRIDQTQTNNTTTTTINSNSNTGGPLTSGFPAPSALSCDLGNLTTDQVAQWCEQCLFEVHQHSAALSHSLECLVSHHPAPPAPPATTATTAASVAAVTTTAVTSAGSPLSGGHGRVRDVVSHFSHPAEFP